MLFYLRILVFVDKIGDFYTDNSSANLSSEGVYSLTGSANYDNKDFTIYQKELLTASKYDYETKDTYVIEVSYTSESYHNTTDTLHIKINNLPDALNDIVISDSTIDENKPIGTVVGKLVSDDQLISATHTYELVSGEGDDDNSSFYLEYFETDKITWLYSSEVFDFESKQMYSIRVKSTSSNGYYLEKKFTILINDVPDSITDISLSNNTIIENLQLSSLIGTFNVNDEFEPVNHTVQLVAGVGDDDNTSFNIYSDGINSHELVSNKIFDYETKTSYSIRVRAESNYGSMLEKQFTISVLDDETDNCDPSLPFSGSINTQATPS